MATVSRRGGGSRGSIEEARRGRRPVNAPAIGQSTSRGPVQLERTTRVGNRGAIQRQGLGRRGGAREVDETVTGVPATSQSGEVPGRFGDGAVRHERGEPYPENLSRIIFTLTCSPMPNQMLRTKFSSIQGSSSPILPHEATGQHPRFPKRPLTIPSRPIPGLGNEGHGASA